MGKLTIKKAKVVKALLKPVALNDTQKVIFTALHTNFLRAQLDAQQAQNVLLQNFLPKCAYELDVELDKYQFDPEKHAFVPIK